jgi:type IV pilus assembly protein PilA
MKKLIQNKLKNQKGLTLIELLAVIVILAIIAAIAIPAIGNIIGNSRVGAIKSDALNAMAAAEMYLADNPTATSVTAITQLNGYLDDKGSLTAFTYTKGTSTTAATMTGAGTISPITLTFGGTTKANISGFPNNTATASTVNTITIAR